MPTPYVTMYLDRGVIAHRHTSPRGGVTRTPEGARRASVAGSLTHAVSRQGRRGWSRRAVMACRGEPTKTTTTTIDDGDGPAVDVIDAEQINPERQHEADPSRHDVHCAPVEQHL